MSNLSRLSPKILIQIAILLLESDDSDYDSPYDDFEENLSNLRDAAKWATSDVDRMDLEFIWQFIIENRPLLDQVKNGESKVSEIISELHYPSLINSKVWYEIWGNATLTEEYKTTWESYNKDWAKESLRQSYYDGEFDYWQGEYVGHETDNFETDNFEITHVTSEMNESKKSLLSKIVVENTTDVLDKLDKDTLIQLKNLINQKLSSF